MKKFKKIKKSRAKQSQHSKKEKLIKRKIFNSIKRKNS